jgi:hypothetical protein
MVHKGKATSDVSYSMSDGPEAYNNPSFGRRIAEYTEACKQKYWEDYNPVSMTLIQTWSWPWEEERST